MLRTLKTRTGHQATYRRCLLLALIAIAAGPCFGFLLGACHWLTTVQYVHPADLAKEVLDTVVGATVIWTFVAVIVLLVACIVPVKQGDDTDDR